MFPFRKCGIDFWKSCDCNKIKREELAKIQGFRGDACKYCLVCAEFYKREAIAAYMFPCSVISLFGPVIIVCN